MNGIDLRDLLVQRSAASTDQVMHQLRMAGVQQKVVVRRRRRLAAGTVAVAFLVTGTAAVALPERPAAQNDVADPPRTIEGFPEYAAGARVVAGASAKLPTRTVTFTFTPTTDDLVVFSRCEVTSQDVTLVKEIKINNEPFVSSGCTGSVRVPGGMADLGVRAGEPSTVTMTITGARMGDRRVSVDIPDTGAFALAVGERVPFADYPLPPRPARLPALESIADPPEGLTLRADPAEPARTVEKTVVWRRYDTLQMVSATPGFLRLWVNGVEVHVGEWWDYEQGGSAATGDQWEAIGLRPGKRVRLTVTAQHVSGDWLVTVF